MWWCPRLPRCFRRDFVPRFRYNPRRKAGESQLRRRVLFLRHQRVPSAVHSLRRQPGLPQQLRRGELHGQEQDLPSAADGRRRAQHQRVQPADVLVDPHPRQDQAGISAVYQQAGRGQLQEPNLDLAYSFRVHEFGNVHVLQYDRLRPTEQLEDGVSAGEVLRSANRRRWDYSLKIWVFNDIWTELPQTSSDIFGNKNSLLLCIIIRLFFI